MLDATPDRYCVSGFLLKRFARLGVEVVVWLLLATASAAQARVESQQSQVLGPGSVVPTQTGQTRVFPPDALPPPELVTEGKTKKPEAPVFADEVGEPIGDFREAWLRALKRCQITDLRFHDLRGEFASRLVERGVPLSQVRDLLGHASIVTTERYDRQRFEALEVAVNRLDTGETFNFLSSEALSASEDTSDDAGAAARKSSSVN